MPHDVHRSAGGASLETEIEALAERLAAAERKALLFDYLMQYSASTFCIVNHEGRLDYQSPNIERITGYSAEEVMSQPAAAVVHPEDLSRVMQMLLASDGSGSPMSADYRALCKDGSSVPVRATFVDLTKDPVIRGFLIMAMDISELGELQREKEQLQDELRHAQKVDAIGTLAGGVAHDFNNLLQLMSGFTELALRHLEDREAPVRAQLEQVLEATERARDLVLQILTFSRRVERQSTPLQLGLVLHQAVKLLRTSLPAHIEMRLHLPAASAYVLGDPSQIHQVLINVCMNSLHAMKESGGALQLELTAEEFPPDSRANEIGKRSEDWVRLRIRDEGEGMEEASVKRMFDPFFTTKPMGEGTGLGLSVVHGIVAEHGGRIEVQSSRGGGTTVDVLLPVLDKAELPPLVEQRGPVAGTERVALVEDEPGIAILAKSFLEHLGYRVQSFANGEALLEQLRASPKAFDILVTDFNMPRLSGIELVRRIRHFGESMPVILTTGYGERLHTDAAELGVRCLVAKPYGSAQLGRAIRQALDEQDV